MEKGWFSGRIVKKNKGKNDKNLLCTQIGARSTHTHNMNHSYLPRWMKRIKTEYKSEKKTNYVKIW